MAVDVGGHGGEPRPAALGQLHPQVIRQRVAAVGAGGGVEQVTHGRVECVARPDRREDHGHDDTGRAAGVRRLGGGMSDPTLAPPADLPERRRIRPRSPKGRTREVACRLEETYPDALCELDHRSPFELLAATILSAQTTDVRVNLVVPALFARYPTPEDLAAANPADVEEIIRSTGFYQNKTKSLIGMANALVERFGGEVPTRLEDLITVPGVGRKTANVVRSVGFGLPGLPVDTHVGRLSRRLGLTTQQDPVKVELELNSYIPPAERGDFSLRMILHGRRVCFAQRPDCAHCSLEDICPSSQLPRTRRRRSEKPS